MLCVQALRWPIYKYQLGAAGCKRRREQDTNWAAGRLPLDNVT